MGLIATSKIADCDRCGAKDTACRKRKKEHLCLSCCRQDDVAAQLSKQREKQKVRSLGTYQRQEGIVDSIQELVLDIDRVQSRYVRLAAMGKDHKIECYCCRKKVPWQKAQLMHFINRSHLATRFLLQNGKAGCFECNVEKRGNLEVYEQRLNEEQPGLADWLKEQSYTVANPTRDELKMILTDFQFKLKLVETKLT